MTKSAAETKRLAAQIAKETLGMLGSLPGALVISLEGDLGSGKTTFAQGFARGLGIRERILSPTFVLMKSHGVHEARAKSCTFYHIDCYRLEKPQELLGLGWRDIIRERGAIVLVEWGDKIRGILPKHHLKITFSIPRATGTMRAVTVRHV